ncbi:MAG: cupin domain-containing protein [Bacteroidota bacterium]
MKKIILCCLLYTCMITYAKSQNSNTTILLDKEILSGIGLQKIAPKWADPSRELYTKTAFSGIDIGVNITTSSNAFQDWKNYAIDEFVYVVNGQAIIKSISGKEFVFNKGDFFMVPKGFTGRWTTKGKYGNFLEVAVYSKKRFDTDNTHAKEPFVIQKSVLSGIDTLKNPTIYTGAELSIVMSQQAINSTKKITENKVDEMMYILNGSVTITDTKNTAVTYYSGDFYVIPKGFSGEIVYNGFDMYREMRVQSSH